MPFNSVFRVLSPGMKICWIFDQKSEYQVYISFFSIIYNNPLQRFIFYFVLPKNISIRLEKFTYLLSYGSEIKIRFFNENHTYMSIFSTKKCPHPKIIIVKLFLYEILPEVDKILYLDADMINTAPISQLMKVNLQGKTLAGTTRPWIQWINSGFIMYNLEFIRKQPKKLWECADGKNCYIDDNWHTNCHDRKNVVILPYRYNNEIFHMNNKVKKKYQIDEENNVVFVHLMGNSQQNFYNIFNNSEIYIKKEAKGCKMINDLYIRLFVMKKKADEKLDNITKMLL